MVKNNPLMSNAFAVGLRDKRDMSMNKQPDPMEETRETKPSEPNVDETTVQTTVPGTPTIVPAEQAEEHTVEEQPQPEPIRAEPQLPGETPVVEPDEQTQEQRNPAAETVQPKEEPEPDKPETTETETPSEESAAPEIVPAAYLVINRKTSLNLSDSIWDAWKIAATRLHSSQSALLNYLIYMAEKDGWNVDREILDTFNSCFKRAR
ncbi:hypothetical protein [Bifidobacterium sp. SO1]|uniref:hypothetical protein n=1 Tax=Bifidobacterium sp. SO1 TaxID=2809029 RepID=UPI001BDD63AF|nr:hypothetical protein [Bifidobacterium sp. SO1]MBT1162140.1 hypothetical protein [Bifidobacterium sp. SO1]